MSRPLYCCRSSDCYCLVRLAAVSGAEARPLLQVVGLLAPSAFACGSRPQVSIRTIEHGLCMLLQIGSSLDAGDAWFRYQVRQEGVGSQPLWMGRTVIVGVVETVEKGSCRRTTRKSGCEELCG